MYYPDKQKFIELSQNGNLIPVCREMLADFDTPLSVFIKVDRGEHSFLLESVVGGERLGRYSIIGTEPALVVELKAKRIKITEDGKTDSRDIVGDPFSEIKKIMARYKPVAVQGLPRFSGGLIGYIGYDSVRFIEDIPDKNPEGIDMPDMKFVLADTILIFDHIDRKIKIVANALLNGEPGEIYDRVLRKIDDMASRLRAPVTVPVSREISGKASLVESNFSREAFMKVVERAKEHIRRGDIIQMVPSQRLKRSTSADPFSIYRALRSINPSPYMYYLKFGDVRVIGSSPEILVRAEEGIVEVRPIAGTRKRGKDPDDDIALEKELLQDPKERAEHIMLVDLGRNDIGRVCEYSSVQPRELMRIERYSHVMHIVSDVTGKLRPDKDIFDVIRATFPAGTVTGAPKVRAMELIDEFENIKRGLYAGSVGYIGFSGNIDLCIAIRTIIIKDGVSYVQAGAGIVLDSEPEKEYEETLNKAKGMMMAIDFAERGLE
ncbi:MAG: anthranilate synthase component I [Candidatus Omnitrophica bacterium]|nr:anthranilate synthase component I [Candidatus Omnitrophota bacterium]